MSRDDAAMERQLSHLISKITSGSRHDLSSTYELIWELFTSAPEFQSADGSSRLNRVCYRLQAYPKLLHAALGDARREFDSGELRTSENAIKVASWVLNRSNLKSAEGASLFMDLFLACEGGGRCSDAHHSIQVTCVWGLRVLRGIFPGDAVKILDVVRRAGCSPSVRVQEENAGLMKSLAENSLELISPHLEEMMEPVLRSLFSLRASSKRRDKASVALQAVFPACWDRLSEISRKVNPCWTEVTEFLNASLTEPVGSDKRRHGAKFLGWILLLFGPTLNDRDEATGKMKLNAAMHFYHQYLAEASVERHLAIAGWRLMIESTVVQNRLVECLPVLRKAVKEGFNAGREPDPVVRREFFVTWTYLAEVALLHPKNTELDLSVLFGVLRRSLADCDVTVRELGVSYACDMLRLIRLKTVPERTSPAVELAERRRKGILASVPLTPIADCDFASRVVLGDLSSLLENTLRSFPDQSAERNVELWSVCTPFWAESISSQEVVLLIDSQLLFALSSFAWKEIRQRFTDPSLVEGLVSHLAKRRLVGIPPGEVVDWVLGVFGSAVPPAIFHVVLDLCGGKESVVDFASCQRHPVELYLALLVNFPSDTWVLERALDGEIEGATIQVHQAWADNFAGLEHPLEFVQSCISHFPLVAGGWLACRVMWSVCAKLELDSVSALGDISTWVASNLSHQKDESLLDCVMCLLDRVSEDETRFQVVLDAFFPAPNPECRDALALRTFNFLLNRMRRNSVVYDKVLECGLQAGDKGIRTQAVEFWNATLSSRKNTSPSLLSVLQLSKAEFPSLKGVSNTAANKRTIAQLQFRPTTTASSGGSSHKQPRIREKKEKETRLGFATYSNLDTSQPLEESDETVAGAKNERSALRLLAENMSGLADTLTNEWQGLLNVSSDQDVELFEQTSQQLLLALWASRKRQ